MDREIEILIPRREPKKAPLRVSTIEVPLAAKECPKCSAKNPVAELECRNCGLVFERYRPIEILAGENLEIAGSTDLIMRWEEVRNDYLNQSGHDAFVSACMQAQALPYAAKKYAEVLEVAPHEEIAHLMRRRIRGFAGIHLEGASPVLNEVTWKLPLPSFNNFILFLGTILVVVGIGLPQMRDVAKLGFSMIVLSLGLRYFLRRPA
ncbi:MAG: hypothetical protein EOP05_20435 [Proteobacteria bacterium]|nr:MAG: hypothetical protein EOP05_20435 [Pseudomonadota bacterium]